jgi:hypothetical protein
MEQQEYLISQMVSNDRAGFQDAEDGSSGSLQGRSLELEVYVVRRPLCSVSPSRSRERLPFA